MSTHVSRGLREGALLIFSAIALFLIVALLSYAPTDPGWSQVGGQAEVKNLAGRVGAWFADVFYYLFGFLAFLAPIIVAYSGWLIFRGREGTGELDLRTLGIRWVGFFITLASGCGLATLHFTRGDLPLNAGGILGDVIGMSMVESTHFVGATILLLALFLTGVTLFSGLSWFRVMDFTGLAVLRMVEWGHTRWNKFLESREGRKVAKEREVKVEKAKKIKKPKPRIEPTLPKPQISERKEREKQIQLFDAPENAELPGLALLDGIPDQQHGYSEAALEAMSRQVELKLADFGVEVQVVEVHPGPVITRFEMQPSAGVKVSKISNLAKDLARALSVISVRIVEVIPGKSTVGLEIPNEVREMVVLSEILHSPAYDNSSSKLTLGLGKDISGTPIVADLAKMPHLLVAGTTGSGKSVGVNAMLLSLLYKATAQEVRLIMIDPKMLELSVYEGIPHLLTPVVTDMKDAANALRWCVGEMERRYKLMRTHTAMHILCGVIWRDYGASVTGGNMKPLRGRMDFEFEHMQRELVSEIEEKINAEVAAARPVHVRILPREEAFQIPDLIRTKINLLPERITQVRVVEIEGLDIQADGGTHVTNTAEVGPLQIVDYKSKGKINKRLVVGLET